jgi:antitoxin-like ribbon-helix-helix protein
MTRFAGLKDDLPASPPEPAKGKAAQPRPAETAAIAPAPRSRAREGKKGILGHFSPELSRTLNIMAIEEGTSVQALMGEAFDLLMRSRGKHPFGER